MLALLLSLVLQSEVAAAETRGPGLDFAPAEFVAVARSTADGSLECLAVDDEGSEQAAPPGFCLGMVGPSLLHHLRQLDGDARFVMVARLEPEGAPAPARTPGEWGELVLARSVRVDVAEDGSFATCVEDPLPAPTLAMFPQLRDPCLLPAAPGAPFFSAADRAGARRARISVALYLDTPPGSVHHLPEPERPLQTLFSQADYPMQARRQNVGGIVRFRLRIDREGSVSGCTVTGSSGDSLLDARTCEILVERARFRPGRDRAGTAVPSQMSHLAIWAVESDVRLAFSAGTTLTKLTVGTRIGCQQQASGVGSQVDPAHELWVCTALERLALNIQSAYSSSFDLIMLEEFIPMGAEAAPAPAPGVGGEVIWAQEIEIELRRDGRIGACRPAESSLYPSDGADVLCDLLQRRTSVYEVVRERSPERRARYRARVYVHRHEMPEVGA